MPSHDNPDNPDNPNTPEKGGDTPHPRLPIRRFDVFAEYNRQKAIEDGVPEDEAMGYGLWLAKVVASRSFGRSALSKPPSELQKLREGDPADGDAPPPKPKWHSLDGKPQTDELFDKEIIRRMGPDFYYHVFAPAIAHAIAHDRPYTSIRDTLRKPWNL
jgi:hypothetical protein